jgi:tripartite-type tricarboxylate transporter receptor subunit TctC
MCKVTRLLFFVILFFVFLPQCKPPNNNTNEYPAQPISFIVPWDTGGMTDATSRIMGSALQRALGQPVNVMNRTGGGGVVGHLALSAAKPNGYTLGAVTVEISMLHHTGKTILSIKNYTPLALLVNNAAAITVRADAPWNSIEELIAAIKTKPGKLKASGTARLGIWDLSRRGFLKAAGLEEMALPWVPSLGAGPALKELLTSGIDVVTCSLAEVDASRKAGQVKTLAVMSAERLKNYPEVPTLKELGYDFSISGWVSICAPTGLPIELKEKLDSAIQKAVKDPKFKRDMTITGSTIQFLVGDELENFLSEQDNINGVLMREAGIPLLYSNTIRIPPSKNNPMTIPK